MMSDETNLADLLALNLHLFEDEVRNIVDKATKELSMEKTLKVNLKFACGDSRVNIQGSIGICSLS